MSHFLSKTKIFIFKTNTEEKNIQLLKDPMIGNQEGNKQTKKSNKTIPYEDLKFKR